MDFLKLKLVEYGMALVIAPLAVIIMQGLKRYSSWVDAQGPWVKRVIVAATVLAFTVLAHYTGVDFGVKGDDIGFLANLDQTTIETLLGSLVAFAIHAVKKAQSKKS